METPRETQEESDAGRVGQQPRKERTSPTDSPLFWLPVFLVGALVALFLTGPKYRWRQPQIERVSQARELSGHAVSATGGPGHLPQPGEAKLTLRPLFLFFGSALFLSTFGFWWWRLSGSKHFGRGAQTKETSRDGQVPDAVEGSVASPGAKE